LQSVLLQDVSHRHFQTLINENMDKPRTCQIIKITFKQVIKQAIRDHYLPKGALEDITEDISLPKYSKREKRPLTEEEKKAIKMVKLDPKKNAFLKILFYTGMRRGEALALTKSDFDFKKKTVSITKVVQFLSSGSEIKYSPKSDNGFREIPLSDALIQEIKPYVNKSKEYLFTTQKGELMTETAYRRMWESIITSLNIALGYNPNAKKDRGEKPIQDLTAHIFRHNFCTELCYQIPAISTKKIAQILGDSERMVLDVYSHIKEENENISDAISNALKL
ncbi:MAG: site-specific integrase, partial [Butyrivibrio sp.]|nr:site-specific integrase [Butyrivibrio sp.]